MQFLLTSLRSYSLLLRPALVSEVLRSPAGPLAPAVGHIQVALISKIHFVAVKEAVWIPRATYREVTDKNRN